MSNDSARLVCSAASDENQAMDGLTGAQALILFEQTLRDGPLPPPVVNFDENALISSMTKDKVILLLGGKLKRLRKKKGKKTLPISPPSDDNFIIDDRTLLIQTLLDDGYSRGDIERRFSLLPQT